jgi:hypothetical protein
MRIAGEEAVWESQNGDGQESISVPLQALSAEQREVIELAYSSALGRANPLMHVVGDPAAWESNFGHALDRCAIRLDNRSNEQLRRDALEHADPVMREQAFFEYSDRNHSDALELLTTVIERDKDPQVRWHALWVVEKLGGVRDGGRKHCERFDRGGRVGQAVPQRCRPTTDV